MKNSVFALRKIPGLNGYYAGSDGKIYTGKSNHRFEKYNALRTGKTKINSGKEWHFQKLSSIPGRQSRVKVTLYLKRKRRQYYADKLIYWAFRGRNPSNYRIIHLNKNPLDCRPGNLRAVRINYLTPAKRQRKSLNELEEKLAEKFNYDLSNATAQKYFDLKKQNKTSRFLINYLKTILK
jgi:hypothetical protein